MVLAAPHPDYREMHVFCEGAETIRDFNMSFYPAGALFKEVFAEYEFVYVRYDGREHYLTRLTPVKEAIEALGIEDGAVVEIYADNR